MNSLLTNVYKSDKLMLLGNQKGNFKFILSRIETLFKRKNKNETPFVIKNTKDRKITQQNNVL